MKEIKVYIDELPKSCVGCPCCSCDLKPEFIKIGDIMYCNLLKQKFRFKEERKKLKDCPLQSLKTHDRELVKEVCEKIRTMAHKIGKLVFCEHCYTTNSARTIDENLLNEILGQIESEFKQKEFEK